MAYPKVHIVNSTNFSVKGKVSATVHTPGHDTKATPYESSGTSYSQFAVLQTEPGKFTMTRIVT